MFFSLPTKLISLPAKLISLSTKLISLLIFCYLERGSKSKSSQDRTTILRLLTWNFVFFNFFFKMCLLSNKALSSTVCTTHYGISSLGWNLVFWPPRVQESYTSLRLAYTRFARFAICFALYTILELVEVKNIEYSSIYSASRKYQYTKSVCKYVRD